MKVIRIICNDGNVVTVDEYEDYKFDENFFIVTINENCVKFYNLYGIRYIEVRK